MIKYTLLAIFVAVMFAFASTPTGTLKVIQIGVKDHLGAEFTAATIPKVTYKVWLEQGIGAAITLGDTLKKGASTSCVTYMVSYRGCAKFDLQLFDIWGMNNIVKALIKDENGGLKAYYETLWTWTVDDISIATKIVGLAPLNPASGNALNIDSVVHSIEFNYLPSETKLHQNYPNPFNPTTSIKFDLAGNSNVNLSVYNYNGQLVKSLVNGTMNAGFHTVNFDASSLSAGVYYYTMETAGKTMTNKMVLVK